MAINFSVLNNITPFELNTSVIGNTDLETINNMAVNADALTTGYIALILLTVFFLDLVIRFYSDQEDFKLDTVRTLVKASGWTALMGIALITGDLIFDLRPIAWALVILLISGISSHLLKKKNL